MGILNYKYNRHGTAGKLLCRFFFKMQIQAFGMIIFFATVTSWTNAQKLYTVVNLTAPFSGISYAQGHNRQEFKPSVPRINLSWGVDWIYRAKKISHKLSVEQAPFERHFKVINKFMLPPNNERLLGHVYTKFSTSIDHFIISYALQREAKDDKGFLFHSRIRFNYSFGVGVSFNRSREYYRTVYPRSSGGSSNTYTYMYYDAIHHRDGMGLFLRGTTGFDFVNKAGKRRLSFNIFYNQGLKDMAHFDVHYRYGYWNDPAKRVDVSNQQLRSRGTVFGFSLGAPITILR